MSVCLRTTAGGCAGNIDISAKTSMLGFALKAEPKFGLPLLIEHYGSALFPGRESRLRNCTVAVAKYSARVIRYQIQSLSGVGLVLGALFFAASLTPTLIPRNYLTQGVLAGACFAIGYGAGVFWRWLWHYLELPEPSPRTRTSANALVAI